MGGKTLTFDPAVHRVSRDPKMRRDFIDRVPAISKTGIADWSRHESTIMAESRKPTSITVTFLTVCRQFALDR